MSRNILTNVEENETPITESLDELIRNYAFNKDELDSYKSICDDENAKIKKLMEKAGEDEHQVDNIVAKKIIQHKQSMNEAKLLSVIKEFNIPCVKTIEVVDMEEFERYLYHNTDNLPADLSTKLAACTTTTETVTLRLSRKKEK